MGRVVVINHVTLDGVMQGPGRLDEDTRGGFAHGGWAVPRGDHAIVAKAGERMGSDRAFLFGRRTYEQLLASWNSQGRPFKDALNNAQKYVASHSPATRLEWPNSTLLDGDVPAAVAALKQASSGNLVIMGSGELIAALMAADLIDEYLLMTHPLVLGTGRRLFPAGLLPDWNRVNVALLKHAYLAACMTYGVLEGEVADLIRTSLVAARDADGPQNVPTSALALGQRVSRGGEPTSGIPPLVRAIAQEADGPGPGVVLGGWVFVSWYYRIPAGRKATPQRRQLNVPLRVGRKSDGTVSSVGP
jgi:dihydrofolate reductase